MDGITLFGPEFAYANGRFSLLSEYYDATINRSVTQDLDFTSWHVAAT